VTAATHNRGQASLGRLGRRLPKEALITGFVLVIVWILSSRVTPDYVVPPIQTVASRLAGIVTDTDLLWHAVVTITRVLLGLVGAFVIGTVWGLLMGWSRKVDRYSMPVLQITQGVPSLSWVVIAIIWFQSVELRIWFILVVVTLPGFAFQALDSYRAIPRELRDMARSLRPRRFDMFRTVTAPSVAPDLLTAWKINLGLGTRVVLVAELVGAAVGVGYQLLVRQQRFDMAGVIAWTGVLVIFVLIVQKVIERIELRLLRYRPGAGGDHVVAEAPIAPGAATAPAAPR
jgi:NitT/TauT family transport system permease protein